MICIHCDNEFDHKRPRHAAVGKVNECADCADDVKRTTGVIDGVGKTDYRLILQRDPQRDINRDIREIDKERYEEDED